MRAAGEKWTTPMLVASGAVMVPRSHTSPVNRPASPRSKTPSVARATFTIGTLPGPIALEEREDAGIDRVGDRRRAVSQQVGAVRGGIKHQDIPSA